MASTSAVSFQGLSTGIQTDALVNAILAQEGKNVTAMQARQDRNKLRTTALTTLKSNMTSLSLSLASLQDKFNARTVTSSDSTNTYATATAVGATAGTYDLKVTSIATKGQLSPTQGTTLSVADPSAAIYDSANASFAIQGTDGVVKAFQVGTNSLYGLRDSINASGAGVVATVINSGQGTNPYQLVITAKETGTGTTSGVVSLAAINNADGSSTTLKDPVANPGVTLGITAGAITGTFAAPTGMTGGLTSAANPAKNAVFTLNGIELTRSTNAVTDVAEGVTFNLKQGGQTGTTVLTVAQDKTTATAGLQDVLTKYNTLLKTYKDASTTIKNSDGSINQGPLSGDASLASMIRQIKSTLVGTTAGLPSSATFQTAANLGVRTQSDGTLTLDTYTFQNALDKDPTAARRLFVFGGETTSGVVTVKSGTSTTATGSVSFTIDSYTSGGAVSGTFQTSTGSPITLTGSNGALSGTGELAGLSLAVTGLGSGTLTLSRGAGQAASDLLSNYTSYGSGSISVILQNIQKQNESLAIQINSAQATLDRRKVVLQTQFAKMEVAIGQMKSSASSLTSM